MKRFLFLLSFLMIGALTSVEAQSESKPACCKKGDHAAKSCCAKKSVASDTKATCTKAHKASTSTVEARTVAEPTERKAVASAVMAASEAASKDESIEARTCEKSGNVSYYKMSACPVTGKVSYKEVEFDESKGQFVNASPSEMKKASCTKSKQTAKVVKTSVKE